MATGSSQAPWIGTGAHLAGAMRAAVVCAALITALPVAAEGWRITPSLGLRATLTDNVDLDPDSTKEGDFVTEISPGISIRGVGARARLNLAYRFNAAIHASDSGRNEIQNYLSATGMLEAIDNWLFIDANASITQEALSAFGPRGTDSANVDRNRTETFTYRLSPYVQGRLGANADYLARYAWTATDADAGGVDAYQIHDLLVDVKGATRFSPLTWAMVGNYTQYDYEIGRDSEAGKLQGILSYRFDPQFQVSASLGRESNNYRTLETETYTTYGGGFEWAPTERTQVSGFGEDRFFGTGYNFSLRHRTPRTSWSISESRDVDTEAQQLARAGQGAAFDLVFDALASRIPDPELRAQATQLILNGAGIPADLNIPSGALTTRVFVERRRKASVAFLGVRNTVTLGVGSRDRRPLNAGDRSTDDFNQSTDTFERTFSASWAHNLTAMTSMNLLGWWSESTGASSSLETDQWNLSLLLTTRLGPRTNGTLGLRYVRFDNSGNNANSYRENAVTAALVHSF